MNRANNSDVNLCIEILTIIEHLQKRITLTVLKEVASVFLVQEISMSRTTFVDKNAVCGQCVK